MIENFYHLRFPFRHDWFHLSKTVYWIGFDSEPKDPMFLIMQLLITIMIVSKFVWNSVCMKLQILQYNVKVDSHHHYHHWMLNDQNNKKEKEESERMHERNSDLIQFDSIKHAHYQRISSRKNIVNSFSFHLNNYWLLMTICCVENFILYSIRYHSNSFLGYTHTHTKFLKFYQFILLVKIYNGNESRFFL